MLRLATLVAAAALAVAVIGTPLVASAQAPSLNWGNHVTPARCPTEINVTRKVENDNAPFSAIDPGSGAWAVRDFNQHIQVWQVGVVVDPPPTGGERFCALVRYQGSFATPGDASSPGRNDDSVTKGVDGSFEGGYLLVFTADERTSPAFKTQGHIGTFDGPIGLYDWLQYYFTNSNVTATTIPTGWGWIYHGGNNGAWVNAISGNQGDITD